MDQKLAMVGEGLIQDTSPFFSVTCWSPAPAATRDQLRRQDTGISDAF